MSEQDDPIMDEARRYADQFAIAPRAHAHELTEAERRGAQLFAHPGAMLEYARARLIKYLDAFLDRIGLDASTRGQRYSDTAIKVYAAVMGIYNERPLTINLPGNHQLAIEAYNRIQAMDGEMLFENCLRFVAQRAQGDEAKRRRIRDVLAAALKEAA